MNFGKDVSTLKYFTICGLQEGYEPFAVNMNRDVTMWLSKRLPQFVPVPPNHQHIEVRVTWKMLCMVWNMWLAAGRNRRYCKLLVAVSGSGLRA